MAAPKQPAPTTMIGFIGSVETVSRRRVLECIPILILQPTDFPDVKFRKRREHMSAERFFTRLASQVLCNLATRACKAMHRNRIAIIEEKRECGAEMSPCDLRLVEIHLPTPLRCRPARSASAAAR